MCPSSRHTYLECDEATLADLLEDAVRMKDLPGMTDVDASLLYFCGLVKRKIRLDERAVPCYTLYKRPWPAYTEGKGVPPPPAGRPMSSRHICLTEKRSPV